MSVRGKEQANGLVATLHDDRVARVLISPTVRCHATVIPLSHQRGLPVEPTASLEVHAPVERLLELVVDPSLHAAVLCGHGEQIRGLLRLLADGVRPDGRVRLEKGSIWVLDVTAAPVPDHTAVRKPPAGDRLPFGAAAAVGALLAVGFLLPTLAGVPT